MEVESKTGSFYGDLVSAAMSKDVKRMVELIDTLDSEQVGFLVSASTDIVMMLNAIRKIKNGN